jgi:hypothetical protein
VSIHKTGVSPLVSGIFDISGSGSCSVRVSVSGFGSGPRFLLAKIAAARVWKGVHWFVGLGSSGSTPSMSVEEAKGSVSEFSDSSSRASGCG